MPSRAMVCRIPLGDVSAVYASGINEPSLESLDAGVLFEQKRVAMLFKVVTDVLERLGFAVLICVMIAIISGVQLSYFLFGASIVFFVLTGKSAYQGHVAERTGKSAIKPYLDAMANALVGLGISLICVLVGIRVF
jgi:hypothetical protein